MLLTLFMYRRWAVGWGVAGVLSIFFSDVLAQKPADSVADVVKEAKSAAAITPATLAAPSVLPVPRLGGFAQANPFDPERKQWQAKIPPSPPPPVPAPVTDDDLSIYGIVMAGDVQKVILKPGKRFETVPVGSTGLASVYLGGQLGEFVLTQVMPDQILLNAPGGQQWVRIGRKNDRSGGSTTARNISAQPPSAGSAASEVTPLAQANPFAQPMQGGDPALVSTVSGSGGGLAPVTASPPGSLAAAIAAAQAKQVSQPTQSASMVNPFEALLQQQKLGR